VDQSMTALHILFAFLIVLPLCNGHSCLGVLMRYDPWSINLSLRMGTVGHTNCDWRQCNADSDISLAYSYATAGLIDVAYQGIELASAVDLGTDADLQAKYLARPAWPGAIYTSLHCGGLNCSSILLLNTSNNDGFQNIDDATMARLNMINTQTNFAPKVGHHFLIKIKSSPEDETFYITKLIVVSTAGLSSDGLADTITLRWDVIYISPGFPYPACECLVDPMEGYAQSWGYLKASP